MREREKKKIVNGEKTLRGEGGRERERVQIEERNKNTNREIIGDGKTLKDERDRERWYK